MHFEYLIQKFNVSQKKRLISSKLCPWRKKSLKNITSRRIIVSLWVKLSRGMRRVSVKRLIFGNEGARFGQDGAEGDPLDEHRGYFQAPKGEGDAFPARNSPTGCKRVYTRVYVKHDCTCWLAVASWKKKRRRVCIERQNESERGSCIERDRIRKGALWGGVPSWKNSRTGRCFQQRPIIYCYGLHA